MLSGSLSDGRATVLPRYGEASLADVLPGVLAALMPHGGTASGVAGQPDTSETDPLGLAAGPLHGVRAVMVLLVDGLGHHNLALVPPSAPTLTELAAGRLLGASARAITTGFPSTTPTSLVSLGTGAAPGRHGVLGFTVNIPGTERVLTHIDWSSDPDPVTWQPLATQFDRAVAAGVAAVVVGPIELVESGLTVAAYRGGSHLAGGSIDSLADGMLAAMAQAQGPVLVYGYHPDVDKTGHGYGLGSPQWLDAITELDRLLTRLVDGLTRDTALVVTADHGQFNAPAEHRVDCGTDERLRAGVRLATGEPRVRYVHCRPGAVSDVRDTWREVLGDTAWVVERDEAVAQGWFGPVPPEHLPRIGDLVVACHGDHIVLNTRLEPPSVPRLIAFHGSATEAEMMIPLLIVRR